MKKGIVIIAVALALGMLGLMYGLVSAETGTIFVVNSAEDTDDGTCDGVHCTFREAIHAANASPTRDTIQFNMSLTDVILLQSQLPTVTVPVVIDGSTQPGTVCPNPKVAINAFNVVSEVNGYLIGIDGLVITGGNSEIKGLDFRWLHQGNAIVLQDNGGNVLTCNRFAHYLYSDASYGTNGAINGTAIHVKNIPNNVIGGSTPDARNQFGFTLYGIRITGSEAVRNTVQGNVFGGEGVIGTDSAAIKLVNASHTQIGGASGIISSTRTYTDCTGICNTFIGNNNSIRIEGGGHNHVAGNFMSQAQFAHVYIENGHGGLQAGNLIGGTPAQGNVMLGGVRSIEMRSGASPVVWQNNIAVVAPSFMPINIARFGESSTRLQNPNDADDVDSGPNGLQNYVAIVTARTGDTETRLDVALDSTPNTTFDVEFFSGAACNSAENQLNTISLTTDAAGDAASEFALPIVVPIGHYVTAIATGPEGSSEMTPCTIVTPPPLVVNNSADTDDGVCDSADCTLREAINQANSFFAPDLILFDLGVQPTIAISGSLPAISETVTIDGSQNGGGRVALDGTNATGDALQLLASQSTFKSLVIYSFPGNGIVIMGNNNRVLDTYIGTDHSGTVDLGNGDNGILILKGADNQIGGASAGEGNLLSGNAASGLRIDNKVSKRTVIQGNRIGTDATGNVRLRNDNNGILIFDSPDHLIGGDEGTTPLGNCTGACNLISGNGNSDQDSGIWIGDEESDRIVISGNYIGTNISGTVAIPNSRHGIYLRTYPGNGRGGGDNITIGGYTAKERNVISGNNQHGIYLTAGNVDVEIIGNYIGVDVTGSADLGNGADGIHSDNSKRLQIGDATGMAFATHCRGGCNVISGNGSDGIELSQAPNDTVVQSNYVGTDRTGMVAIGNAAYGIYFESEYSGKIGGASQWQGNLVSGNGGTGIRWRGVNSTGHIEWNMAGVNRTGSAALPNGGSGLALQRCNNCLIRNNVFSGNGNHGLYLDSADFGEPGPYIYVRQNRIGIGLNYQPIGNGLDGIQINGANTVGDWTQRIVIGGLNADDRNVIANSGRYGIYITDRKVREITIQGNDISENGSDGIRIDNNAGSNYLIGGDSHAAGNDIFGNSGNGVTVLNGRTGATIRHNWIVLNSGLAIDLDGDGPTANDAAPDADAGANTLLNKPLLAGAVRTYSTARITGTLQTITNSVITLDFYGSLCQFDDYVQTFVHLGSADYLTDENGHADINAVVGNPDAWDITATATDANGNTSEFSTCVTAVNTSSGAIDGYVSLPVLPVAVPARKAPVDLYRQLADGSWLWAWTTETNYGNGSFLLDQLDTGVYAVRARPHEEGYAHTFYQGAYTIETATQITVTDGMTETIGLAARHGAQILGSMKNYDTGQPVLDGWVQALQWDGERYVTTDSTETKFDGTYALTGVLPGEVIIRAGAIGYYSHYYEFAFEIADAQTITVADGEIRIDTDMLLFGIPDEDDWDWGAVPPAEPTGRAAQTHDAEPPCAVSSHPATGQSLVHLSAEQPQCTSQFTISEAAVTCTNALTPTLVTFNVGATAYDLTGTVDGYAGVVMLERGAEDSEALSVGWQCDSSAETLPIGSVVYAPSYGTVHDATTGEPIADAVVTLHTLPQWQPRLYGSSNAVQTCDTTFSLGTGETYSQIADPSQAALALESNIFPATYQLTTGAHGSFGWTLPSGCYFVEVNAAGYQTGFSPIFGTPGQIKDFEVALSPSAAPTAVALQTVQIGGGSSLIAILMAVAVLLSLTVSIKVQRIGVWLCETN